VSPHTLQVAVRISSSAIAAASARRGESQPPSCVDYSKESQRPHREDRQDRECLGAYRATASAASKANDRRRQYCKQHALALEATLSMIVIDIDAAGVDLVAGHHELGRSSAVNIAIAAAADLHDGNLAAPTGPDEGQCPGGVQRYSVGLSA
jgi:hypothetical protein